MTASFWIILLAVLAYGGLHSWLASLRLKRRLTERFGKVAERAYRLVYNLVAVITLLPVLLLPVALVDAELYRVPLPWMALLVAVQVVALLVLLAGVLQTGLMSFLGVCQLVRCEDNASSKLVVSGLYRWVRHPLYTAGLVFIWLMPVMTWNLLALNLGISTYIVVGAMFEERKLLADFGPDYATYKRKTPMLIPGLQIRKS
jgi:protein-S-isoprenylcysteine O-methyltransferase Ste14